MRCLPRSVGQHCRLKAKGVKLGGGNKKDGKSATGILKIGKALGIGTGTVQRRRPE